MSTQNLDLEHGSVEMARAWQWLSLDQNVVKNNYINKIYFYMYTYIYIGYEEYSSTPVLQTLARFLLEKAVIDIFFLFR